MDISRMLAELREERARIEEAIIVLERLETGAGRRRGRPPKWMSDVQSVVEEADSEAPKRRRFSPEARKRMAEAQRKRWAAARGESAQE